MDSQGEIQKVREEWGKAGKLEARKIEEIQHTDWVDYFRSEISAILTTIEKVPEDAYEAVFTLTSFVSDISKIKPMIGTHFLRFSKDLIEGLRKLASYMGDVNLTVTIGIPFVFEVGFTFPKTASG